MVQQRRARCVPVRRTQSLSPVSLSTATLDEPAANAGASLGEPGGPAGATPARASPPPLDTHQVTRHLGCPTVYFRIHLQYPGRASGSLFSAAVSEALQQLHGALGAALPVTLLRFDAARSEGFLAVDKRDAPKVWPAAALLTQLQGKECRLRVLASSPFLVSLANDSESPFELAQG